MQGSNQFEAASFSAILGHLLRVVYFIRFLVHRVPIQVQHWLVAIGTFMLRNFACFILSADFHPHTRN